MILITTAGKVGTEAARLLAEQDQPVRVLVRDPRKASALTQAGAQVIQGDLEIPATIDAAMRDVSAVVLVSPAMPAQELNVIDSAVRAGVEHVVKDHRAKPRPTRRSPSPARPDRYRRRADRLRTRIHTAAQQRLHAKPPHARASCR